MLPAPFVDVVVDGNSVVEVEVVLVDVVEVAGAVVVTGGAAVVLEGAAVGAGPVPDGEIRTSAQFMNSSPPTKPSPLLAVNQCQTRTP